MSLLEEESDEQLVGFLASTTGEVRLRALSPISDGVRLAAHQSAITIDPAPITGVARLDLAHFVKEQSLSQTMHRYGRLTHPRRA